MTKVTAITLAVINLTVKAGEHGDKAKGIPAVKPVLVEIPNNRRIKIDEAQFDAWERNGFVRAPKQEENVNLFPWFDIAKGAQQTSGSATGHSAILGRIFDEGMAVDSANEGDDDGNDGDEGDGSGDGDGQGEQPQTNANRQNAAAGSAAKTAAANKVKAATAKPTATSKVNTSKSVTEKPKGAVKKADIEGGNGEQGTGDGQGSTGENQGDGNEDVI